MISFDLKVLSSLWVFPVWSSACVHTLFKKKNIAFGEDFSGGIMPKRSPRIEGEEHTEEVVDKEDVDEEDGGTDGD
jgi:hypothetical protein